MIRTEAGGLRAFRGLTPADSTRKELACWDLSSEFLASSESMVSNPAICGARGTTRTILAAHLCASVPVPKAPPGNPELFFSQSVLVCSTLLPKHEKMAALRRALADVQALQARLRGAGLDDTLPSALGPSPVPGATPRQVLETGRPEQKDRTCNDCVFNGLSGCQVRGSSIIRHFDPTQPLPEDMAITTTSGFMCNSCYKRILIWRKERAARRGNSRLTRSQAAQSLPVPVAARATRATEVENLALTGESVMRVTLSFVSAHMMLRCVSGQEALGEEEKGTDQDGQVRQEEAAEAGHGRGCTLSSLACSRGSLPTSLPCYATTTRT